MKIGIITFHWATNYGAVLQAYALQKYLSQHGYDVKIIDYIPYTYEKKIIKCFITKRPWRIPHNLLEYRKERSISTFRTANLNLSIKYQSVECIKKNPPEYDVYICGSDQIWNPSFTATGERKHTLGYFLDFGPVKVKRIAYAASFGCTQYPEALAKIVAPIIAKFDAVSVRENCGRKIANQMGIKDVWLLPDPTLLLRERDYECLLLSPERIKYNYSLFFYSLHTGQKTIQKIKKVISRRLLPKIIDVRSKNMGIEAWLTFIKVSRFVVTNSFHGMVFSILFRKPFIVVPVEGSSAGMNDRIYTLLGKVGLEERILIHPDESRITDLFDQAIIWEGVEDKIDSLRNEARLFFENSLKNPVF